MKSWIDRTETHSDKDCYMEFNWVGDVMFSIAKARYSNKYLVQITSMGLYFYTDSVKMAYDVVKAILVKEK